MGQRRKEDIVTLGWVFVGKPYKRKKKGYTHLRPKVTDKGLLS